MNTKYYGKRKRLKGPPTIFSSPYLLATSLLEVPSLPTGDTHFVCPAKKKIVSSTRISGTAQKEAVDIFFVWFICFNRDTSFFFCFWSGQFLPPCAGEAEAKENVLRLPVRPERRAEVS